MPDIIYLKLHQHLPQSSQLIEDCARLYCEIWKEPPWCEDFWQEGGIIYTISQVLTVPKAQVLLAIVETEVVGFSWGYATDKYELQKIAGHDGFDELADEHSIFYISELGVARDYRQHQVGEQLTTRLLASAKNNGANLSLLRTDVQALPARKLYLKVGFEELPVIDGKHSTRTYWAKKLS